MSKLVWDQVGERTYETGVIFVFQTKAENQKHILINRKSLNIAKSSPKPKPLSCGALTWGKEDKRKGVQRENH